MFFIRPLTNKHCMTWSSMISLWINCRTHQKYRILLLARQSPNNNLELSKENVLGNIMLSHLPCFTWKFFMIWFHKILKLIFKKQPSCSINICTKHWRKLPNLTAFLEIFLFLKNKDSVKHVKKVLLIVLSIYFEDKIKFSHCIWSIWLFWILFLFSSAILLSKMKSLFFSQWKFAKFLMSFSKPRVTFSSSFCITLQRHQR